MELLFAFVALLAALVTALVYGLGGTLVIHGVFGVGTLMAFIALVSQLYRPLNTMSGLQLELLTALVCFDRVFEILDLEPLIAERPAAYPLTQTREAPGVEVAGVWFRYPAADQVSLASLEPAGLPEPERPGDAWVLRDVTFQASAGKLTALVGPSGAGKTTITHLVPRPYDPVSGAVRIGGHDVRDLTLESLRSNCSPRAECTRGCTGHSSRRRQRERRGTRCSLGPLPRRGSTQGAKGPNHDPLGQKRN